MNAEPGKGARSRQFELVSHWDIAADIATVWDALRTPEDYPRWWPYVRRVVRLKANDASGVGAVYRYTWTSRLPYELSFEMQVVEERPPLLIEGRARGELDGVGRWQLSSNERGTQVCYDWCVDVTRPWMRAVAPLLGPAFRWNHGQVMAAGERGLRQYLESRSTSQVAS